MKISIITVCYNSEKTIRKAMESVLNQSFENIEYVVVDGGSTDNTVVVIREYQEYFGGRMKWISEPDDGIYDAMNKGIKMASGDVIGMLNADDEYFDSEVVRKIVASFNKHPENDCLYGNLVFVNANNKVVRKWQSRPFRPGLFAKSWSPAHPTFYCKRAVFEKYGLYKTDYKIAADVEFMFRVLELKRINSYFLNENFVRMSVGGVSTNGIQSTLIITKELQRAFRENGLRLNIFKYLFYKGLKFREYL